MDFKYQLTTPSKHLGTRIREVFLDGKWIANTNYKKQLSGLNWQEATQVVAELNTIALLSFHINYYLKGLISVLKGGELTISDKYSFDSPAISSQREWKVLVDELLANAAEFAELVEQMPEQKLAEVFVKASYGNYARNIEAVIEHAYYHLGQIVLIRKMIAAKDFFGNR
jgi:uncharacterized damage-inducible protein DinB